MKTNIVPTGSPITVPYYAIRNISSPEDTSNARTVYSGQLPIQSIVGLPTNENVRGYLVEAEGKKRRTKTQVHRAIRETLDQHPDVFTVLNSGVVIVAREVEVDEKNKVLTLKQASIINGSQTQGEITEFLASKSDAPPLHIKFELICTGDDNLIAEISIARNFQNDVATLSIAGRRGQLDELNERFQAHVPNRRLSKSETERPADNEYIQTEKLLQVIAALLPAELWWKGGEINKVYTYSAKATCLRDFQAIYLAAKDPNAPKHADLQRVYSYYLDICGQAFDLYEQWRAHPGFEGTGLRSIVREGGRIKEVPDGIIFPILASLSEFVVKTADGWEMIKPVQLEDRDLISAAKTAYMEIAKSKPELMGKNKACYSALSQITSIYRKLLK